MGWELDGGGYVDSYVDSKNQLSCCKNGHRLKGNDESKSFNGCVMKMINDNTPAAHDCKMFLYLGIPFHIHGLATQGEKPFKFLSAIGDCVEELHQSSEGIKREKTP